MRTAILTAITHKGVEVILAPRTLPLPDVRAKFQAIKGEGFHADYRTVYYQESDSEAQIRHFKTKDEHESLVKQGKINDENNANRVAEMNKNPAKFQPPPVEKIHDIMTANPKQFPAKAKGQ